MLEPFQTEGTGHWQLWEAARDQPAGLVLNHIMPHVQEPFVVLVMSTIIPTPGVLSRMHHQLTSGKIAAVGGPLIDAGNRLVDFCHEIVASEWKLSFTQRYRFSYLEMGQVGLSLGPCKLCSTLAPTFLTRTNVIRYVGYFNPRLDGEWALLDFFWKVQRMRGIKVTAEEIRDIEDVTHRELLLTETDKFAEARHEVGPWRWLTLPFVQCPALVIEELEEGPHLWGRQDVAQDFFFHGPGATEYLSGRNQADIFMTSNELKFFEGPDRVYRDYGCTMTSTNCDTNWLYKGFRMPPCCQRTLRKMLLYIHDVFEELGFKYMLTDGALLGSFKVGDMLDWDGDIDLHVANEDFYRIERDLKPRVIADGHWLTAHPGNRSWLLQANDHNYLYVELNLRDELFDDSWKIPLGGRYFPAMASVVANLTDWYGHDFLEHVLRHVFVGRVEDAERNMKCSVPGHHNCLEPDWPPGANCAKWKRC
jgi:hypothetical protein